MVIYHPIPWDRKKLWNSVLVLWLRVMPWFLTQALQHGPDLVLEFQPKEILSNISKWLKHVSKKNHQFGVLRFSNFPTQWKKLTWHDDPENPWDPVIGQVKPEPPFRKCSICCFTELVLGKFFGPKKSWKSKGPTHTPIPSWPLVGNEGSFIPNIPM